MRRRRKHGLYIPFFYSYQPVTGKKNPLILSIAGYITGFKMPMEVSVCMSLILREKGQ